jgi:hypothetical protein
MKLFYYFPIDFFERAFELFVGMSSFNLRICFEKFFLYEINKCLAQSGDNKEI